MVAEGAGVEGSGLGSGEQAGASEVVGGWVGMPFRVFSRWDRKLVWQDGCIVWKFPECESLHLSSTRATVLYIIVRTHDTGR